MRAVADEWHAAPATRFSWPGAVQENAAFLALLGFYMAGAFTVELTLGVPVGAALREGLFAILSGVLVQIGVVVFVIALGRVMLTARHAVRSGKPPPRIHIAVRSTALASAAMRAAVCLVAVMLFFRVFVGLKSGIPLLQPFAWDITFASLDRALHLGVDPWRLLHPLVGYPVVTLVLDRLYSHAWYLVAALVPFVYAWLPDGPERRRFFITFFLTWVLLGNVLALVLSSAGPCYFDFATGAVEDPYAPLLEYLYSVDGLAAIRLQEDLLERHLAGGAYVYAGIAAMPSLHVAIPVLFALALRGRSRLLACLMWVYAVIILVGSVHLGWHYAVDGYASLLLVPLIWRLSAGMVGPGPGPVTVAPRSPPPPTGRAP